MITIKIDADDLLEMLVERVKYWTKDDTTIQLYEQMYDDAICSGCYDGAKVDVMYIVDNDYVNYCRVIKAGDDDFEKVQELAKNGEYDISCKNTCYNFIEAYNYNFSSILVRY